MSTCFDIESKYPLMIAYVVSQICLILTTVILYKIINVNNKSIKSYGYRES